MNKIILSLLLLMSVNISSRADETLNIAAQSMRVGSTLQMAINLTTERSDYAGFQMDLVLPKGVSVTEVVCNSTRTTKAAAGAIVSTGPLREFKEDATKQMQRIACLLVDALYTSGEGAIVYVTLTAEEDVLAGEYTVGVQNVKLVRKAFEGVIAQGQKVDMPDVQATLTIYDYILGDVNGDGNVTPSDAIMILYHYFNVAQTGFRAVAADLNGDSNITPADAIEALYRYFGAGQNHAPRQIQPTLEPQ